MAYEQNPLKYSRTSNMPGLEYSEEDISQKKRIASNALGITQPADLLDGEFFLKDNDPQDFYRTLYIKRGESLDKVVTFTDTGKAIFDGVNEINLSDDEEVKGVLPKKKIITAAATVQVDNISTIVTYDGNKFQEVRKDDFVNKVVDDVNAGINLADYFNKNTDILPVNKGGTGTDNGFNFQNFFEYSKIGTSNATLQEFWNNLPLNISGCIYIPYGTVADLIDKFGILFFIKAANRRYLKFIQFSTNFGSYDEYVLIDDASKSDITFNDFIHTTANGFPKKAYPLSGVRRYSSEFSNEEEIYKLKMNIGDVLSVNNITESNELIWRYKTRFPQGGNYYVDLFSFSLNQNNKILRTWSGIYAGGSYIRNNENTDIAFLGKIVKIG